MCGVERNPDLASMDVTVQQINQEHETEYIK